MNINSKQVFRMTALHRVSATSPQTCNEYTSHVIPFNSHEARVLLHLPADPLRNVMLKPNLLQLFINLIIELQRVSSPAEQQWQIRLFR
jgi:hypothetical protein